MTTDTLTKPAILDHLENLFDPVGTDGNKFQQLFDDPKDARKFALKMKEMSGDVLDVRQTIGRVIMTIKL